MPHTSPEASLIKGTGGFGSVFVSTTATNTGDFFAIKAVTDCTFLTLSCAEMENVGEWVTSGIKLYAGDVLAGGNFTEVSLSGSAILFKH